MMEIKKSYAEIDRLYGKNESSIPEVMKNKEKISFIYRLSRIKLKRQNPLLSCVWERLHCKCMMQCTVHFIITLFNVGNVLLWVIYQLKFTVFMYVVRISRYLAYIAFGIIRGLT